MPTIILEDQAIRELDQLVASGRFASREHAVREAVQLLVNRGDDVAVATDGLDDETRRRIEEGLADEDAGRVTDASLVLARLHDRYINWPRAAE